MKKLSVGLLLGLAVAALPVAHASVAHADVCGNVGGPALEVNGCVPPLGSGVVGSVVVADAVDEWRQRASGRPPCYTAAGVPYYTPGDEPCY